MTVLEAVKNSRSPVFTYKGSIKLAQSMLLPTEELLWAMTTSADLNARKRPLKPDHKSYYSINDLTPFAVAITNRRILFAYSILGDHVSKDIQLDDIQSIDGAASLDLASLRITTLTSCIMLVGQRRKIADFRTALDSAISTASKSNTSSTKPANDSYVDELKSLKELYDTGVITEAEFSAKKAQILNL